MTGLGTRLCCLKGLKRILEGDRCDGCHVHTATVASAPEHWSRSFTSRRDSRAGIRRKEARGL